jgi:hypothetical protein
MSEKQTAATGIPPQENAPSARIPVDCGDFEITIRRDGTWLYRGSPIGRMPLVKLFATVLERDETGTYWLRTPAERGTVTVEDAPFIAVELDARGEGRDQVLIFRTNVDDSVEAGPDHPIRVPPAAASGAAVPYIRIRGGLEARLGRAVYYQLVELGNEEEVGGRIRFGVWSSGTFYPLDG